eukprot:gene5265-5313_t
MLLGSDGGAASWSGQSEPYVHRTLSSLLGSMNLPRSSRGDDDASSCASSFAMRYLSPPAPAPPPPLASAAQPSPAAPTTSTSPIGSLAPDR